MIESIWLFLVAIAGAYLFEKAVEIFALAHKVTLGGGLQVMLLVAAFIVLAFLLGVIP